MRDTVPLLAQTYGHRDAAEAGRKVGEITANVLIAVILTWGLIKLFRWGYRRRNEVRYGLIQIWNLLKELSGFWAVLILLALFGVLVGWLAPILPKWLFP